MYCTVETNSHIRIIARRETAWHSGTIQSSFDESLCLQPITLQGISRSRVSTAILLRSVISRISYMTYLPIAEFAGLSPLPPSEGDTWQWVGITGDFWSIFACLLLVRYFTKKGSRVYCAFVDASKAFDKVLHNGIYKKLLDRGAPVTFVHLLKNWYGNLRCCVHWNNVLGEPLTHSLLRLTSWGS